MAYPAVTIVMRDNGDGTSSSWRRSMLQVPESLSAGTVGSSSVVLSWEYADNDQTGFEIRRSTDGETWTTVATAAAADRSRAVGGLSELTQYYFSIRAVDAVGSRESIWSDSVSATTIEAGGWQLSPGQYIPRDQDMEAVFPRPDEETNSWAAHRIAYPGLKYRRRLFIREGSFPHYVDLKTAPSGMVTDATFGSTSARNPLYKWLEWDAPETPGTHTVAMDILDQEYGRGTNPSEALPIGWDINVDSSLFIFCDAIHGDDETGDGTHDNPFKTINGWYKSSAEDSTYAGKAVYYKSGTYIVDAFDPARGSLQLNPNKPLVHLAYPGSSVVFSMKARFITSEGCEDIYFDEGITIYNTGQQTYDDAHGFWLTSAPKRTTLMCDYEDLGRGYVGDDNPAGVFIPSAGAEYFAMTGRAKGYYNAAILDSYGVDSGLCEDFILDGDSGWNQSLFPKSANRRFQFRLCRTTRPHNNSEGVLMMSGGTGTENGCSAEYCYLENSDASQANRPALTMLRTNSAVGSPESRVNRARRNTLIGALTGLDGTFTTHVDGNIVVSNLATPIFESGSSRIVVAGEAAANATFGSSANAVDYSTGYLQGQARQDLLNVAGWEIET